jgi:hypothetical protein
MYSPHAFLVSMKSGNAFIKMMLLLVDKSTSGWRPPKKVGYHITFYVLQWSGVECISGSLVVEDEGKKSEQQSRKN